MNREDPYRDQAEKLRKKIDRNPESEARLKEKSELPPRSRLHRERRQKNKWKLKYPMISLLALFFVLLPITIYSMYHYLDMDKIHNAGKSSKTEAGFETVGFEDEGKATIIEVRDPVNEEEDEERSPSENEKPISTPIPNPQVADQVGSNDTTSTDKTSNNEKEDAEENKGNVVENEKEVVVYHTVKPNETIYRIAMNYYQSQAGIETIKKANNLRNNDIQAGQVLVIPKNK